MEEDSQERQQGAPVCILQARSTATAVHAANDESWRLNH
jgi:hypothetical protein